MLQMHPEERANCGQVVELLETITARISEDENYSMSPVPGNSQRPATDLSTRSLSQPLYFDPDTLQITPDRNNSQTNISDNDAPIRQEVDSKTVQRATANTRPA